MFLFNLNFEHTCVHFSIILTADSGQVGVAMLRTIASLSPSLYPTVNSSVLAVLRPASFANVTPRTQRDVSPYHHGTPHLQVGVEKTVSRCGE
jgi:hypothetical protein